MASPVPKGELATSAKGTVLKASIFQRRWEFFHRHMETHAEYEIQTSGISIIKSERKRNEKIGGSVKCGKTCPAFMTSIREQQQEAIKITVEYQSVHAGREMEVGKLNHGNDRRNLAALLKAGVPSTKIIEDIQNKCLPTERLGLLTKKDLHDVSHSFKLDKTVLHSEDSISVDLQVKKCKGAPIILF
ncbi:MULE domain-containing protein [Trichonephila clavipes]|nr:MULE domain-containing protein [Trichonephila clavipes]